jgi:FlaA1/EpsC-like NDP-sugar epimerase
MPLLFAAHSLLAAGSYLTAFWLRADFALPGSWLPPILSTLPIVLGARLFAFHRYGLFEGWWEGAAVGDFVDIVKAVLASTAFFVTAAVLLLGVYTVPRSVVLIDTILMIALLAGSRVLSRSLWAWLTGRPQPPAQRAVVVGPLQPVEALLRELFDNPDIQIHPVGVIGLDGRGGNRRLHGVPVLGDEAELPRALKETGADVVLLALSNREGAVLRRIVSRCPPTGVSFKIVPPLRDVIDGRRRLQNLRDLSVDDLLGRPEVNLDVEGLRDALQGRKILITGAGGSIGSELARQVAAFAPARIVLLDRNERALAALDAEFRERAGQVATVPVLADIGDRVRMEAVFAAERPEVVYHAAAYKHVPMMEINPVEAFKNNVLATRDLLEIADRAGVDKFVLISTDKAVKPINIMGATKRVAEHLVQQSSGRGGRKIAVRFGNVFGSEGSVVPILLQQIRHGGPVTVTHPEATRYFMTLHEAARLVLQASVFGEEGEIFVLDMGEPVRILDLATSLIRLAGLEPGRDIEIRFTGLRLGERLHEETLVDESAYPTRHPKIWVIRDGHSSEPVLEELARLEQRMRDGTAAPLLGWLRRVSGAEALAGAAS